MCFSMERERVLRESLVVSLDGGDEVVARVITGKLVE